MIDLVQLTAEEILLLNQHFRKSHNTLIRERAQTVLAFNDGVSPYQLSIVLRRSEKTVREWIQQFHRERISSIFPCYHGENAAKLTRHQKQEIQHILAQPPSIVGISQDFWDISTLRRYIKAEFGVEYESNESYRLIFQLHNYSFHLPDTFDRHRDEKKVAQRIKEIKREIQPMLNDSAWVIFTGLKRKKELLSLMV